MNTAILWIRGEQQAVDDLLQDTGALPDKVWKRGDAKIRGAVHENSGFSVVMADAETPLEMVATTRRILGSYNEAGVHFDAINLSAELSLGLTVGDPRQFAAIVSFTPDDLRLIGSLGISLSIAAYPCSNNYEGAADVS